MLVLGVLVGTARAQPAPPPSEAEQRSTAERACAAHDPSCDWFQTFSNLEKQSIARALADRGYEIDPHPWGKQVARIHVYNENVFAEDNWLRFFNFIHYTTRERAILDELTIQEGDLWNDALVQESARRLRDPLYSSVIALLPVKSAEPGKVDLLVVTRDVWSIRLNTQYTFQQGSLTNLSLALSENNFLGHRNLFAAALTMDQGSIALGPLFIDKNLLGKHLDFRIRVDEIFTRQALDVVAPSGARTPTTDPKGLEDAHTFHSEGSDSSISLAQPLWSLASEWGWGTSFSHRYAISRTPLGTGLRGYNDPDTPDDDMLPREYHLKYYTANANVVRQWGELLKFQLAIGHTVTSQKPSPLSNFPGDAQQRADFIRDVLPRNEVISQPYVEFSFYQPRYRTVRNLASYELAEDLRLGPDLDVSLAQGLKLLGSDYNYERPSIAVGWTLPWCRDGFVRPSAGISWRIQDGRTIDNTASAQLRAATPLYPYFRVIAQANIATRWHDTQNAFYSIGSDSGLRGYPIAFQIGQRRVSGQVELRTVPVSVWVLRLGAVAFYELGGAANSLAQMPLYQDVGVGLRMLVPQTSRDLFRFDVAFPLVRADDWPILRPHLIAGFDVYF